MFCVLSETVVMFLEIKSGVCDADEYELSKREARNACLRGI
jgi:hypothetical protein